MVFEELSNSLQDDGGHSNLDFIIPFSNPATFVHNVKNVHENIQAEAHITEGKEKLLREPGISLLGGS